MRKYFCILLLVSISFVANLDNDLGKTPPMGWNSWNHYNCNINEEIIKQSADALVSSGLAELGYVYVNIDDCWQRSRDENGRIVEDKETFPNGIRALADYIHSKGLKFGIYSSAGDYTCQKRPGSLGFEEIDAQTYVDWGVDYLKYDNCFNEGISGKIRYPKMRDALKKAGGNIFYSMCSWGEEDVSTWAGSVANSWRTTGDITDNWDSFIDILDKQQGLEVYAGPSGWNDPDMLEVGNGGMTTRESQAHFALWAMLKSPLLIGCDLNNIKSEDLEILKNYEIIEVNQDKLGKQAKRIKREETDSGFLDYYSGELDKNSVVVLFHNRSNEKRKMEILFKELSFPVPGGNLKDIINHIDYGFISRSYSVEVESHGVYMFILHQYCSEGNCEFLK